MATAALRVAYQELIPAYAATQHERQRQLLRQCLCGELFHRLEVECIHGDRFKSRAQMRESVFEYAKPITTARDVRAR